MVLSTVNATLVHPPDSGHLDPPRPMAPTSTQPAAAASASGTPLPQRALYEQVAETVRARILAHTLGAGSWIDEKALADELGISRTPLREALKVLASEGLVTMKLRRGAYVTEVSERDLAEVFHLLALLECDAVNVLARRATADQLAQLQALHEALEAAVDDRDRFFAANEAFHLALLTLADNRWRLQLVTDLRKVMKLKRHHSLFRQGRVQASLQEHRAILAALQAHDADRAVALMRDHLAQGQEAAMPA
jgi:DNA-binding GntR family transcriptional regulator